MIKTDIIMRKNPQKGAVLLVMVVMFAAIGIFIGLGRLLSHRYNVERRINRQYQIDKMLAARSAVNFIHNKPLCLWNGFMYEYGPYTNLIYRADSTCQKFVCDLIPTPILDLQTMTANVDFTNWVTYTSSSDAKITPRTTEPPASALMEAICTTNAQRCAMFKKTDHWWMDNEFGYMYTLDPGEVDVANGLNCLRLSLIGVPADKDLTYLSYLKAVKGKFAYPSITHEFTTTNGVSSRSLRVFDPEKGYYNYSWNPENLEQAHPFGFMLMNNAMLGYGLTAETEILYSDTVDLSELIDVDDFKNAWVVIEHVFPTNPVNKKLKVPIDYYYMKEPTTYSVSVYNSNLQHQPDVVEKSVVTWVLQTKIPKVGSASGTECMLDTFGGEPCSLKYERLGEWPKPGVE